MEDKKEPNKKQPEEFRKDVRLATHGDGRPRKDVKEENHVADR